MPENIDETEGDATSKKLANFSVIGVAISFVLAMIVGHYMSPQAGILIALVGMVLCLVPISIYHYMDYDKYRKMENHFPSFLEDFAEAKKSGMTFPQAFITISKTDYGSLSSEIRKSAHHLTWNIPFPKVMDRLAKRMSGSRLIHQAFTIINEAYNSGGNVTETMSTLATNITKIKQIEDERRSIMSEQVFVIYFIFFLFLAILVGLYQVLIPMTAIGAEPANATATSALGGGAIKGFAMFGKQINYCGAVPIVCDFGRAMGFEEKAIYFKSLFLLMSLIQGLSSGIVAGQIGEGTMIAGVKHAGIMITVTFISFLVFFG